MAGVLEGVRVVDFGQYLAGPMTAMFLADYGADVVRVDPPGGPRWSHPVNAALQRGKRSIVLDVQLDADLDVARRLIDAADIVIEGFRPGVMDRLQLSADSARARNPRLIWCSLPGFGRTDPRAAVPGWEGVVCSAAGLYPAHIAATHGDPSFSALPMASCLAAFVASHRIAAALVARHRYGSGDHIEVPLFDAAFEVTSWTNEVPPSRDPADPVYERAMRANIIGFHLAGDGRWIEVDLALRTAQALLTHYLPGLSLLSLDDEAIDRVRETFAAVWPQRTAAEWERFGQEELRAGIAVVQSTEEWLEDEHAVDSECIVGVHDPELGPTRQAGFPVLLSRTAPSVRFARRPLDADRAEILGELDELGALVPVADSEPATGQQPALDGIRVVDASILVAGPMTGRILAQYGAEVIKVDKAGIATGDINPLSDDNIGLIAHRTVNAGKRMMFLDLRSPAGQRVAHRLIESADVVHHNFTPKAAERLGLGLEQVRSANQDAIYSTTLLHSVRGFRENYRGHDALGADTSGVHERLGGDGPPRLAGHSLNDNATGHLSAFGILLALFDRYREGEPQEVNAALSRTATMLQLPFMVAFKGHVRDEPRGPDVLGWGAFDRLYRASDGWFYLSANEADGATMLGSLEGLEFVSDSGADIERRLEASFAKAPAAEWVDRLRSAGLAAHRYVGLAEHWTTGAAWDRELLAVVEHPGVGKAVGLNFPVVGTAAFLTSRRPGIDTLDLLDEHGLLAELPDLLRDGVVAIGENPVITTTAVAGWWENTNNATAYERQMPQEMLGDDGRPSTWGVTASIFATLAAKIKAAEAND